MTISATWTEAYPRSPLWQTPDFSTRCNSERFKISIEMKLGRPQIDTETYSTENDKRNTEMENSQENSERSSKVAMSCH